MTLLTPGAARFRPVGLLRQARYAIVTVVDELATNKRKVARWFGQPPGASELMLLESIDRLAKSLKNLQLTTVPRFDRVVEGDGGTWMLFDFVDGIPLSHYLELENTVSDDWIVWWLYQLAQTLQGLHAHSEPFLVGHIEPSDVMVVEDRLYLCDLGLFEDLFPEFAATRINKNPFINFVAPEKHLTVQCTPAMDLFSAAAIAFWLATGHSPMVRRPGSAERHLAALRDYRPNLPPEVCDLISQLLEYYPSGRGESAAQVVERLAPFLPDMRKQTPPAVPDLASYKFAAQATRIMTAPRPVFEADDLLAPPGPAADAPPPPPAPAPAPEEPEAPAMSEREEFLEDLRWELRKHPGKVLLGVGALVGVVAWAALPFFQPPAAGTPRPLLQVTHGHVLERQEASGRWALATDIPSGVTLSPGSDSALLQFEQIQLELAPHSVMICEEPGQATRTVYLSLGELKVTTGHNETVVVQWPSDGQLQVGADSEAHVELKAPNVVLTCTTGRATISAAGNTTGLVAGQTQQLALQAGAAPAASARAGGSTPVPVQTLSPAPSSSESATPEPSDSSASPSSSPEESASASPEGSPATP